MDRDNNQCFSRNNQSHEQALKDKPKAIEIDGS